MKKLLKRALIFLGAFIFICLLAIFIISDQSPKVIPTISADELTNKMLDALNKKAFDTLKYVQWTSISNNHFKWHKPSNRAKISWDNVEVYMDLNEVKGDVYINQVKLNDVEAKKYIDKAWSAWCNDSFWMFAHYKAYDKGTTRTIVPVDPGKYGLLVSYDSGGVTPGDKYLWVLNEKYIPEGYKMWVKIIPVGGVYASWENWTKLPNGTMIATDHEMKVMKFQYKEIKSGEQAKDIDWVWR
ncbi:MAG: hypothetical protein RLZZ546_2218 [Bacteroidota bacterium]|jgi:hypothetical protein